MKQRAINREKAGRGVVISLRIALIAAVVVCLCAVLANYNQNQAGASFSETRLFFDTFCTITIHGVEGASEDELAALVDEAFALCGLYDKLLSITVDGSDVWRINRAGGETVAVEDATVQIVERAMEFGQLSDGMFDITIGRLSRLWDFGSPGSNRTLPPDDEIKKALQSVDCSQVVAGEGFVQLNNPDAWLDLGGIAKGFIADEIAGFLLENGVENALIDMGGDIVTLGNRADKGPWRLGVKKPFGEAQEYIGILEVSDVAVVSSGIYERMFEEDGVLYHHILDPVTGYPARSDIIGATILAGSALTGEGLSTIAVLAGSGRLREICGQTPDFIGAVLVLDSGDVVTIGDVELIDA